MNMLNVNDLIGMSKEAAILKVNGSGQHCRIAMENGVPYMLTCDYNPTRVNLTMENDKVVSVKMG